MIIQLKNNIESSQKEAIIKKVNSFKYEANEVKTQKCTYLIGIGSKEFDIRQIGNMSGIADIHIVSDSYQLVYDDSLIANLLRKPDYKSDQIHFNQRGYRKMAEAIHPEGTKL